MRNLLDRRRSLLTAETVLPYNTVIGGEGVNTTTAGELETLLGLSPGDVSYFNLNGNDIQAKIDVSYSIPSLCFSENTNITSFVDIDALVTAVNYRSFFRCSNLSGAISFPSVNGATSGNSVFQQCTSLESIHFGTLNIGLSLNFAEACTSLHTVTSDNPITEIAGYGFDGCTNLSTFDVSHLTTVGTYAFRNCTSLGGAFVNNVATNGFGTGAFFNCSFTSLSSTSITTVGTYTFWGNNFSVLDFDTDCPSMTSIGIASFRDCESLTSIIGANITSIGTSCFRDCGSLLSIDLRNCQTLGGSVGNDGCFTGVPLSGTATLDSFLLTSNGGGLEGDASWIDVTRSWTVTYL